jgi:hypothetical protein
MTAAVMRTRTVTTMMAPRAFAAVTALLALQLLAARAAAAGEAAGEQAVVPATEAAAYDAGVALRSAGKDEQAFRLFHEAWQRHRTPRLRAQLGLAAQALGRWVEAEGHLGGALAAAEDPWVNGKRLILEDALAVVVRHVGSLEVMLERDDLAGALPAGATVAADGRRPVPLPLAAPLRLAAGTVVLEVLAPGHLPVQRSTTVVAGALTRESVRLSPLPPLAQPRPLIPASAAGAARASTAAAPTLVAFDDPPPPRWPRKATYIAAAATLLGAGLATWSGVDTLSGRNDYRKHPTEAGYRDGVRRQNRTNVLLVTTGVLAASTAALALVSDWRSDR